MAEEAIARLPSQPIDVQTPCGVYKGMKVPDAAEVCAVSIVRAGDALLECLRNVWPEVSVGGELPKGRSCVEEEDNDEEDDDEGQEEGEEYKDEETE